MQHGDEDPVADQSSAPTYSIRISRTEEGRLELDISDLSTLTNGRTFPFGFDVYEHEWQITGRWTTGQDGYASWAVLYTAVDRRLIVRRGVCRIGALVLAIMGAINEVTREAGWPLPLNQGM